MKITEINSKGNWGYPWTEDLKKSLHNNTENISVGEKLLLENEKVKVWSIRLPVGKSFPFHKHNRPYFYTIKESGKSRLFYNNGKVVEVEYKKDDINYLNDLSDENYFIHNIENIGDSTLIFTTVEIIK